MVFLIALRIFWQLFHWLKLVAIKQLLLLEAYLHLLINLFILVDDFVCLSCCEVQVLLIIVSWLHLLILWLLVFLFNFLKEFWIMLLKLIRKLALHFVLTLGCHLRILSILLSGHILSHLSWLVLIDHKFRFFDVTCRYLLLHNFYLLLIHELARRHDHLIHHQLRLLVSLIHLLLQHQVVLILNGLHFWGRHIAKVLLGLHIEYLLIRYSWIFKLI